MTDKTTDPGKFGKDIVRFAILNVTIFMVVMTAVYWIKGGVPDSVVDGFYTFWGAEGGFLAAIKTGKLTVNYFKNRKEKKSKKDRNPEQEKSNNEDAP